MTDQPDDTLLEDDVEEHDFNFDNDKEDALLAETEFDNFIDEPPEQKTSSQTVVSLGPATTSELEQPDQEEDVLDIGIAEEDIVDSENVTLSNISKNVSIEEKRNVAPSSSRVQSVDTVSKLNEEPIETLEGEQENEGDSENYSSRNTIVDETATQEELSIENEADSSRNFQTKSIETLKTKSSVISLKKAEGKSYDDVPDLDKVIELVQPAVFSRHRRFGKISQNSTKRIRGHDVVKTRKRDEFVENGDRRFESKDPLRLHDADQSPYPGATIYDGSEEVIDQPCQTTGSHTFHNIVSEFNEISSGQLCPPQPPMDGVFERPILATVQITQERYQIAGDFRFMRPPSQNSFFNRFPVNNVFNAGSQQSNVRRFDGRVEPVRPPMFHSNAALPSPSHNLMPNSFNERSPGSDFPPNASRPPFNSNNFCYRRPPPPVFPNNRASVPPPPHLHPPPGTQLVPGGLPSPSIRQRFPPPWQHPFPPPFPPASFPPSQNHDQQRLRPFSPVQTVFPQPFTRPPGPPQASHSYSSIRPSFEEATGNSQTQFSSNPAQIQTTGPFSQPSFAHGVPSFPHSFSANSVNAYPSPRSVVFHQAERLVRKPAPQNDNNNGPTYGSDSRIHHNNSNDRNNFRGHGPNDGKKIGMSQPIGYYVKESIISTSSASYPPTPFSCNSTSATQPSPPGVFTHQSSPSAAYTDDGYRIRNHAENDQIQYSRYTRQEYYSNTSDARYTQSSNADCGLINDFVSNHQKLNSHYSKRTASSSMDNTSDSSSVKQMRYNNSAVDKSEEDDLAAYREKIEDQKKMREKFVQMKEEQRLKNQMQNFIQNNIKGILQKREQFLQKHEMESNRKKSVNSDAPRKRNQENFSDVDPSNENATDVSPLARRVEKKPPNNVRTSSNDRSSTPSMKHHSTFASNLKSEKLLERARSDDGINGDENVKQLHKLVKIKYKDGTVALKSFPITNTRPRQSSTVETSNVTDIDDLKVTTCSEDIGHSANSSLRRMVVSKQTSSSNSKNDETCSKDETLLVESVRKGITQSSLPLAQRFSNLKPINSKLLDDDDKQPSHLKLKSKTRLVISDDDEARGVWIRNIGCATKTAVIRKMAGTCGTIVRMNWISGHGQLNQAKILFSKSEEARKFVHNFHRKMVDSSIIAVNLVSENKSNVGETRT